MGGSTVSEQYARRYYERLQELGFTTWTLDQTLAEAKRLTQPGQGPAGTASEMLNRWLIEDGFKRSRKARS